MAIPFLLEAAAWGVLCAGALMVGATIGWFSQSPRPLSAGAMAFGAGALIAALPSALTDGIAGGRGEFGPMVGGLLGGAFVYSGLNHELGRRGAKHRKRSARVQRERDRRKIPFNGLPLALGALLDGIPKAALIAATLAGQGPMILTAGAIALANLPEGLSSASGLKADGRRFGFVMTFWTAIASIFVAAIVFGAIAFSGASPSLTATSRAIAAGAVLAMLVETMMPEAFEDPQEFSGLMAAAGFLAALLLSRLA